MIFSQFSQIAQLAPKQALKSPVCGIYWMKIVLFHMPLCYYNTFVKFQPIRKEWKFDGCSRGIVHLLWLLICYIDQQHIIFTVVCKKYVVLLKLILFIFFFLTKHMSLFYFPTFHCMTMSMIKISMPSSILTCKTKSRHHPLKGVFL